METDNRFWGPRVWGASHFITFAYPNNPTDVDKQWMEQYFQSLSYILPCPTCRQHFQNLLQTFPIRNHLQSKDALTKWLVEVHNRVNDRLKKPRLSYEFVKNQHEQWTQQKCDGVQNISSFQCTSSIFSKKSFLVAGGIGLILLAIVLFVVIVMRKQR